MKYKRAFAFILSGALSLLAVASISGQRPETSRTPTIAEITGDLADAVTLIRANYGGKKAVDYNAVFKSSITKMLQSLDPHSYYLDIKEDQERTTKDNSIFYGIGATLGELRTEDGKVSATYFLAPVAGSPAHRAGIVYGDKIVEINGTSSIGKSSDEVRTLLRGAKGTTVSVTVERLANNEHKTFEIVRDAVPDPSISQAYMLQPGTGYIAMRGGFRATTSDEFIRALTKLESEGLEELIVDLRDNPGGLVDQSVKVAACLLENHQVVLRTEGRTVNGPAANREVVNDGPLYTGPIVVLVNGNTASAAEILTGALQDHDRALVVGDRTYSKGLILMGLPLPYGSRLWLAVTQYESPSGRLMQRDYVPGEVYDYLTKGGSFASSGQLPAKAAVVVGKTDLGRPIYGGGGITPDVISKPRTYNNQEIRTINKLLAASNAFAMELAAGRVAGFETYEVSGAPEFGHNLTPDDFEITEPLIASFKAFAAEKYHVSAAQVDAQRDIVTRSIRRELVTAKYGSETARQVNDLFDDQIKRALEVLPEAAELHDQRERSRSSSGQKDH
ncbi:MAG: PDZ domain-containing protein [Acidobacteria bacterium]|nr:PDZ domain-containing protein [Acidobacteriota bacterium]